MRYQTLRCSIALGGNQTHPHRDDTRAPGPAPAVVRRIFHLYAYEPLRIDALRDRMRARNVSYIPTGTSALVSGCERTARINPELPRNTSLPGFDVL